jgi:hypothetical protein
MYWILFIMAAIAAVVVAVVVGGLATPKAHIASRSILIRAPQQTVWTNVRDVAQYAEWRLELESVELVDPELPGVRWREISTNGSVTFGSTEDIAPTRFTAVVLDDDLPWTGSWSWDLNAEGDATRVTVTERGEVANPIFRFIGTHFIGFTKTMDRYLKALAVRCGDQRAEPVESKI